MKHRQVDKFQSSLTLLVSFGFDFWFPIFAPRTLADEGFLSEIEAEFLVQLRRYNPLLFDLALRRLLAVEGVGFDVGVFATRRVFIP